MELVDHWIAFGLLLAVGGAMLRNAIMDGEDEGEEDCGPVRSVRAEWLALLTTAVATSIDAAAVGAGLALVDVDMVTTSALIGVVTFAVAFGGVLIGKAAGNHLGRWAEMAGGVVLIGLGTKSCWSTRWGEEAPRLPSHPAKVIPISQKSASSRLACRKMVSSRGKRASVMPSAASRSKFSRAARATS